MSCIFCEEIKPYDIVFETNFFKAVFDIDPIQQGHILVMTKRHVKHLKELTPTEELEFLSIQKRLVALMERFLYVDGVTIAINNGAVMDEGTHFHIHFIPRYINDGFWDDLQLTQHQIKIEAFKLYAGKEMVRA